MKMNKQAQSHLAGISTLLVVLALAAYLYLAFVFPKTMAMWADTGQPLSVPEQIIAKLSCLCKSFGLLPIPALFLAAVGCAAWVVLASTGNGPETAN